jgi:hypothetical protein
MASMEKHSITLAVTILEIMVASCMVVFGAEGLIINDAGYLSAAPGQEQE